MGCWPHPTRSTNQEIMDFSSTFVSDERSYAVEYHGDFKLLNYGVRVEVPLWFWTSATLLFTLEEKVIKKNEKQNQAILSHIVKSRYSIGIRDNDCDMPTSPPAVWTSVRDAEKKWSRRLAHLIRQIYEYSFEMFLFFSVSKRRHMIVANRFEQFKL